MDFILPSLGENIEKGEIVRVLVKSGDAVQMDQSLLEIETDKAVVEVPSPSQGIVKEIFVKEGEKAKVGQKILTIQEDQSQKTIQTKPEVRQEVQIEEEKKEKVTESPKQKSSESKIPQKKVPETKTHIQTSGDTLNASPAIRRFAREVGVDLAQVTPSGTDGRLTKDDVKNFLKNSNQQNQSSEIKSHIQTKNQETPIVKKQDEQGLVEVVEMSVIRFKTAQTMTKAWTEIPHVTQFDMADITDVMKLRKKYADRVAKAGGSLTITAILMKVVASALKVFPQFNASVDIANEQIFLKKYYNIGIAVDTERGLLVPVLKNVDQKNILEIAVGLNEIAEKARDRKAKKEDLEDATFTISNLGGIGGGHFTPIINPPQVAILGVGRGRQEPVYQDEKWIPRLMLPLSLSYDHRIIDGADAARFLRWVCEAINEPFLMDLEG